MAEFIASSPLVAPKPDAMDTSRALDVGTGSGVLAIFAALRGYRVDAVDINPTAIAAAMENAEANEVADKIDVFHFRVAYTKGITPISPKVY